MSNNREDRKVDSERVLGFKVSECKIGGFIPSLEDYVEERNSILDGATYCELLLANFEAAEGRPGKDSELHCCSIPR